MTDIASWSGWSSFGSSIGPKPGHRLPKGRVCRRKVDWFCASAMPDAPGNVRKGFKKSDSESTVFNPAIVHLPFKDARSEACRVSETEFAQQNRSFANLP
jgi:hypothetical protein